MIDPHEKEWIERAKTGEAEAISQLYQAHKEKVYKFIYFRVGSQADAEDLFQDIMLAAFDSLPRFRGEVPFLHWCYQVARNKVAYFWRLKSQNRTFELDEEQIGFEEEWVNAKDPEEEATEDAILFEEIEKVREKISKVMDQLPENYAQVLRFRFFEGLTLTQVAEKMEITLNYVKVLQNRALKKAAQLYALTS
ncbi:sigma-70 family RNA polymerase sigma factor [Candidatus Peregrinibacteria bacterium]|nr:MAG: sigma-70 family RNA polymerase sigma factor [Candidatus Peregrinibacteria bacterium]